MAHGAEKESQSPTTAQVRKGKHAKRPGEPVVENEPAASPLGTDDEAAGRPAGPDRVKSAVENDPSPTAPPEELDRPSARPSSYGLIALFALAAFLALVIAALMLG